MTPLNPIYHSLLAAGPKSAPGIIRGLTVAQQNRVFRGILRSTGHGPEAGPLQDLSLAMYATVEAGGNRLEFFDQTLALIEKTDPKNWEGVLRTLTGGTSVLTQVAKSKLDSLLEQVKQVYVESTGNTAESFVDVQAFVVGVLADARFQNNPDSYLEKWQGYAETFKSTIGLDEAGALECFQALKAKNRLTDVASKAAEIEIDVPQFQKRASDKWATSAKGLLDRVRRNLTRQWPKKSPAEIEVGVRAIQKVLADPKFQNDPYNYLYDNTNGLRRRYDLMRMPDFGLEASFRYLNDLVW